MCPAQEDTQRVNISVPLSQLEAWDDAVEEHGYKNRTVWIREMVECGRKQFKQMHPHIASGDGRDLRDDVLDAIGDEPMTWDDIRDAVLGDLEDDLEAALTDLVQDGQLEHSPRDGGYRDVRS